MTTETGQVQALQANTIIIFHPGSRYLIFGRASSSNPYVINHCIGRRRKLETKDDPNYIYRDTLIPISGRKNCGKIPPEVESARLQLCHTLQQTTKADGSQRYVTPTQQIAAYNKRSQSEKVPEHDKGPFEDFPDKNILIGDDVFKINPNGDFNIHFPWRRGQFNLHSGVGGSLTAVISDLEEIWGYCISEKLEIPLKDLKHYKAIVIIPTMFEKSHAREMMNLILNRLGFGSTFLIQDHVAATFGAGLATATVVDIGDQKISVSCVEDAISYPQSRIELKYGGGDLTVSFLNLLNQSGVSLKIDYNCLWDVEFISKLKEKFCHFDLSRCGPEEQTIIWDKPGEPAVKYHCLLADELLIVPLSYFNPDLLRGSIGSKPVTSHRQLHHHLNDDLFDNINEATRRGLKETEGETEEEFMDESNKDNENISQRDQSKFDPDSLLGIDQAIIQSIESCSSLGEDLKRKLYSCILVVGGGFKFKGLGPWLHNKILMNTPRLYRTEPQEIITQPKEGDDPINLSFKGTLIIVQLETVHELWIKQSEWNTFGSRILREKSLCQF